MSQIGHVFGSSQLFTTNHFTASTNSFLGLRDLVDPLAKVAHLADFEIMNMPSPTGVSTPLWNLAGPSERREMWQNAQTPSLTRIAAIAGQGSTPVTADQIRIIMPNAGTRADEYVGPLNSAMAAHGITTPEQRAAFLAQVAVESGDLRNTSENLSYSAARLTQVWPKRFPTIGSAKPYANDAEALGNRVYANRMGNGSEASGDGFKYKGRGLMQITGRDNYRKLGFENNPASLSEPVNAADTAAAFWRNSNLNERTERALGRANFNSVSRTVNGGDHASDQRWTAYQPGLAALRPNH